MPDLAVNMVEPIGDFQVNDFQIIDMMMRYNVFAPRLYNWCRSLGFETGKIMPSRAFCADESQGYPIIMLAKHFGTFPFNHGRVGGIVASGRHAPHAEHGKDLVIVQASHVGYDPDSKSFGTYRRLQTATRSCSANCGKVYNAIQWYQNEYRFAQQNIKLHMFNDIPCVIIDKHLLRQDLENELLLKLDKLIETDKDGLTSPLKMLSTAKIFSAASSLVNTLGMETFRQPEAVQIGNQLNHHMFYFRRTIPITEECEHNLEHNLIQYMPQIITERWPLLTAAQINTQIEFDTTFRSIVKDQAYHGKNVLFISGLNIDISPQANQLFPLTKFIPWAAFIQHADGSYYTLEQNEVMQELAEQSSDNPYEIDLEEAIQMMTEATEIIIEL